MSYSLNPFKARVGDYIGENYKVIRVDTRSLHYSSNNSAEDFVAGRREFRNGSDGVQIVPGVHHISRSYRLVWNLS